MVSAMTRAIRETIAAAALAVVLLIAAPVARVDTPPSCILQFDDMPPGYEIDTPHRETTNAEIVARSGNPNLSVQSAATGRVTGFEVIYSQPSIEAFMSGPIAVQSWVATFDNADGAHAVLSASPHGELLPAPEMGEESVAWRSPAQVGLNSLETGVLGYAFRRSPDSLGWTDLVGISVGVLDKLADFTSVSELLAILQARGCT